MPKNDSFMSVPRLPWHDYDEEDSQKESLDEFAGKPVVVRTTIVEKKPPLLKDVEKKPNA